MKIGNIGGIAPVGKYTEVQRKKSTASAPSQRADGVELSGSARSFSAALKALKDAPDVRMDRVEQVRARIQDGAYQVSSRDIADKMLSGRVI